MAKGREQRQCIWGHVFWQHGTRHRIFVLSQYFLNNNDLQLSTMAGARSGYSSVMAYIAWPGQTHDSLSSIWFPVLLRCHPHCRAHGPVLYPTWPFPWLLTWAEPFTLDLSLHFFHSWDPCSLPANNRKTICAKRGSNCEQSQGKWDCELHGNRDRSAPGMGQSKWHSPQAGAHEESTMKVCAHVCACVHVSVQVCVCMWACMCVCVHSHELVCV